MNVTPDQIAAFTSKVIPHDDVLVNHKITSEICAKCKGMCCKHMGCEISHRQVRGLSKDSNAVESNTEIILEILKSGIVSLDWWIAGQFREYYLRMRHADAYVVDPSWGGRCICLTESGCALDAHYRPLAGLSLTCSEVDGKFIANHGSGDEYDKEACKNEWLEYPVDWDYLEEYDYDDDGETVRSAPNLLEALINNDQKGFEAALAAFLGIK